jgi:hypothetical protein
MVVLANCRYLTLPSLTWRTASNWYYTVYLLRTCLPDIPQLLGRIFDQGENYSFREQGPPCRSKPKAGIKE